MTKPSNDLSIGLWLILTLLLGLKLTVRPDLSWGIVLMPVWIPFALLGIMFSAVFAYVFIQNWRNR